MKIKKLTAALIISTISLCGIFAQQKNDFEKICTGLSKSKIVRGDFEQTQTVKKTARSVKSSGKFTISADDGMIWFTEVPVKSVMAVTKTFMVQEMNGRKRKIDGSKNPTFTNMANVISSLFTGNYEEINKNFEVTCVKDENTKSGWIITLTPTDKTISSYIKEITVTAVQAQGGNTYLTHITMISFSEDTTSYELKNQVVTDTLTTDEAKYFEK